MNCKQYQERILTSLLASEVRLPRELIAHQQECAVCREFFEAQTSLFRAMDAGLQAMVNQEIPPSLIAGVRARLDEGQVPGRAWFPTGSFALVAAVAILIVGIGYVGHRTKSQARFSESASVTSHSVANPERPVPPALSSMTAPPHRKLKIAGPRTFSPTAPEAAPEVIVHAEERQAFAKFVAEIPEERDVALALARPAPVVQGDPVEIALMQIDSLEVKPLESMARE